MSALKKTLLIGYGNPGRQDDGLGPACAAAIEAEDIPGVAVESNYQLVIEDSADIAACDTVIFADACMDGTQPFVFRAIEPAFTRSFTSHLLDPPTLLAATESLFGKCPKAYMLQMRGYQFGEFAEGLSASAVESLNKAVGFLRCFLAGRQDSPIEEAKGNV